MARQTCPYQNQDRPSRYAKPAPLYDRVAPAPEPEEAAAPAICPTAGARERLAEAEMRITRHPAPIPAASTTAELEALALLRQQNQLLTDMLCALNAQLAAQLGCRRMD